MNILLHIGVYNVKTKIKFNSINYHYNKKFNFIVNNKYR